ASPGSRRLLRSIEDDASAERPAASPRCLRAPLSNHNGRHKRGAWMKILFALIGAAIGGLAGGGPGALVGLLAGLLLAALLGSSPAAKRADSSLESRVAALEDEVADLRTLVRRLAKADDAQAPTVSA